MMALHLLLLAILQGITELFPISSLGQSVLVPALLHWQINRDAPDFLPFLVVLHAGTALALFLYFWRDWRKIFLGFIAARGNTANKEARLLWLLVVASIPAGLIGLLLEKRLKLLFGGFALVAVWLMINGIVLLLGDRLRRREARQNLESLSFGRALLVGVSQALALIPGMSRSGVTLVAGLGIGLDYEASARFSFLMATPIIAAATLLEVPKLFKPDVHAPVSLMLACGALSGLFAYLSAWFLMRYFRDHEKKALRPFGLFCLLFGAFALIWQRFA